MTTKNNTIHNPSEKTGSNGPGRLQMFGLFTSPIIFLLMLLLPAPEGMSVEAWRTAAIGVFMALLWITEAIPIPATALCPLLLFPLFGVADIRKVAAPYANPLIFLFMGGFIIALGMQRWNLHRRIALNIIKRVGMRPKALIAGFMISAAFLSMWVSNTATTLMMLPIGISVVDIIRPSHNGDKTAKDFHFFSVTLMLSIAYAASIGGLGTLIGTPPNAFLAGFMQENYGYHIGFAQWMMVGVPLVLIGLPLSFLVLTNLVFPIRVTTSMNGSYFIDNEIEKMGPMSKPEKHLGLIFILVALCWMTRPLIAKVLPAITDTGIAIFGALLMFVIPVDFKKGLFLLDWKYAEKLPWGVLLLFGGGLSLASAINQSGLATWIGNELSLIGVWPLVFVIVITTATIIFLTELTSNTATAAAFLPIMASVALSIGQNPLLLVIPATLAASCAFMLPVATPPNAIVYGSGQITIPQMMRAGIVLNFLFIFVITSLAYSIILFVFQIEIGTLPGWIGAQQ